jgi:hypothetical protein
MCVRVLDAAPDAAGRPDPVRSRAELLLDTNDAAALSATRGPVGGRVGAAAAAAAAAGPADGSAPIGNGGSGCKPEAATDEGCAGEGRRAAAGTDVAAAADEDDDDDDDDDDAAEMRAGDGTMVDMLLGSVAVAVTGLRLR